MVEEDLKENPVNILDLKDFSEEEIFKITKNPEVVYGTTLNAVMFYHDVYLCIQLGDGGILLLDHNNFEFAFDEDEENVANLTYSLCSENAYNHLKIKVYDAEDYDGVIVCTDGLLSPYQCIKNLNNCSFTNQNRRWCHIERNINNKARKVISVI